MVWDAGMSNNVKIEKSITNANIKHFILNWRYYQLEANWFNNLSYGNIHFATLKTNNSPIILKVEAFILFL